MAFNLLAQGLPLSAAYPVTAPIAKGTLKGFYLSALNSDATPSGLTLGYGS
jgi:hypothetical protein